MFNFLPTCISSAFPTVFFLNVFCISSPFLRSTELPPFTPRSQMLSGRIPSHLRHKGASSLLKQNKSRHSFAAVMTVHATFSLGNSLYKTQPRRGVPFSYEYTFRKVFFLFLALSKAFQLLFYTNGLSSRTLSSINSSCISSLKAQCNRSQLPFQRNDVIKGARTTHSA